MTNKEESKSVPPGESTHEKRAQTIMLAVITLLMSWSFNSLVQMGKDIATINAQLVNVPGLQKEVNQHGLDINGLRIDVNNSKQAISDLQSRKH